MAGLEGTSFDQYHFLSLLGQGGMSEVYLAQDVYSGDQVAVKVVSGSNPVYLERFRREAEAVDKLHHEHILPALDYGDHEPWHYLVMPYVPDGTLRERLQSGPISLADADNFLEQIAEALQFAHEHGIIHRDIKPSNILMRDEQFLFLADFGLVKNLEGGEQLTQTGALLGTPEYMSPDLADGPATASSDIYALGVLLYQMVSGFVPFTGDTPIAVYWKHLRDQALPPSLLNPDLSPAIDSVLLRALEKDRTRRYQSTRELAQAFHQAVYTPETMPQPLVEVAAASVEQSEQLNTANTYSSSRLRRFARREHPSSPYRPKPSTRSSSSALRDKRTPRLTASLPPLPLRRRRPTTPDVITLLPETARRSRRRRHRLTGLTLGVLFIGLFLFVILPMGYIYYIYNTQHVTVMAQATAAINKQLAVQAQATTTARTLLNATSLTPVFTDPLIANTKQRWTEDTAHCTFTGMSYQVLADKNMPLQTCPLLSTQPSDATIQVDVALVNSANAGILLRANGEQFYDFELTNQGQFFFRRHDSGTDTSYVNLLPPQTNNVILQGLQHNTLTVIANKDLFMLFINGTFVGEVHDSTYTSGSLVLVAGAQNSVDSSYANFTNFKLFPLS
jgi:serine/threonine protein kinase